jgi:hypothetical protein
MSLRSQILSFTHDWPTLKLLTANLKVWKLTKKYVRLELLKGLTIKITAFCHATPLEFSVHLWNNTTSQKTVIFN